MKTWFRWGIGFLLSTLIAWAIGARFVDRLPVWEYVPEMGMLMFPEGYARKSYREGWGGDTRFGKFGLQGSETWGAATHPGIAIIGDSYVEGFQVPNADNIYNAYNESAPKDQKAIAFGRSDADFRMYRHVVEKLSHIYPSINTFYIVANQRDLVPAAPPEERPVLVFVDPKRTLLSWRPLLDRWHLNFFYKLARQGVEAFETIRLRPGPCPDEGAAEAVAAKFSSGKHRAYWEGALDEFQQAADGRRLVFFMHSDYPRIEDGGIQLMPSDLRDVIDRFILAAKNNGIDVIDFTKAQERVWQDEGLFLKGFDSSFPSQGHWNRAGHRAAAARILAHVQRSRQSKTTERGVTQGGKTRTGDPP